VSLRDKLRPVDWILLAYLGILIPVIGVAATRLPKAGWLIAGHVVVIVAVLQLAGEPRLRPVFDWYPVALPLFTFPEAAYLSRLVLPGWHDAALVRFESGLFATPPTLWLVQRQSVGVTELLSGGYLSFYLYAVVVGGLLYFGARADRARYQRMITAMAAAYVGCYVIYLLWPTEGPRYALPAATPLGGPLLALVHLLQRGAGVHGNAFPSAHAAMGAVAVFYLWGRSQVGAVVLALLVVLMSAGAVYLQYHYASDLVAGLTAGSLAVAAVEVFARQPA